MRVEGLGNVIIHIYICIVVLGSCFGSSGYLNLLMNTTPQGGVAELGKYGLGLRVPCAVVVDV